MRKPPENLVVIGLLGRAGSGKSTAAAHLERRWGARRASLARPLKDLAARVFGFDERQLHGTQEDKEAIDPRWKLSPREVLIRLGNGARDILGPDVWLNACLRQIYEDARELPAGERPLYVVEDVRYPNEARAIANGTWHRGAVIKLECPDAASVVDRFAPSERSVDEVDSESILATVKEQRSVGGAKMLKALDEIVDPWLAWVLREAPPVAAKAP